MEMPIYDLSQYRDIDWSQPQTPGVYRCTNGWDDSDGWTFGCQKRGVIENKNGDLYCHQCALIGLLNNIQSALENETEAANLRAENYNDYLNYIDSSLSSMAWRCKPWWSRAWTRIQYWRQKR